MEPKRGHFRGTARGALLGGVALMLAGCAGGGWDLRQMENAGAAPTTATAARPAPDSRGVITYPDYQVLVADGDETVAQIAGRLGIASDALAQRNGLTTSYRPRPGEVLLLPGTTGSGEIEAIAGTAIAASTMTGGNAAATTPVPPAPVRHRVESGETAYSIARTYDVSVKALADWNGLDSDYSLRAGQTLLIPTAAGAPAARPVAPTTAQIEPEPARPGAGSPTPVPPSARQPLPAETAAASPATVPPSPDLGQYDTGANAARLAMPVSGDILRDYDKAAGREGIDIAAAPGSPVRAADDGVIALVSRSVEGDTIVLIRHAGNINTVYDNVTSVTVEQGDTVRRGQAFAEVAQGDPQALRFGVGIGTESTDPLPYLQ
ncbi:MAG: LysM peptidoglycan-binding domain-containing protein [Rhodobacteraceae bacterium]|jgi:murein DD-endopeptidase MepM/ murein hydrolase activator NlpD|nr:LysM peptidoglycan-binding domain-containing protein [Paracoccaceae bacterium]